MIQCVFFALFFFFQMPSSEMLMMPMRRVDAMSKGGVSQSVSFVNGQARGREEEEWIGGGREPDINQWSCYQSEQEEEKKSKHNRGVGLQDKREEEREALWC
ncbi:hypothetical protein QR685DRAFT_514980 [Neurospora intermedia]|uniref:Secreted protein n=1 Tax=Neurospora intermedia TaxID=5142 RepID=A0ABR3DJ74_NEUIN